MLRQTRTCRRSTDTPGSPILERSAPAAALTARFDVTPRHVESLQPAGKLADAELHFSDGVFEGLKLIGFSIWERRGGGGRNVTFPARQYAVNGERRSFALLRPIADTNAQERIRGLVLQAYADYEEAAS